MIGIGSPTSHNRMPFMTLSLFRNEGETRRYDLRCILWKRASPARRRSRKASVAA
jgi:hypothetical protein